MSPLEPRADNIATGPDRAEHYRRQLATIVNNATLALFIMDEQQHCTYLNPAAEQLTGFTLAEVQGRPLHDFVHHTRPDGTPYPIEECPVDNAFPQNVREQGEEVFIHKEGHFYPVAFTASPILDGGRPVGTILEVRDISDEKYALEREHLLRELEAYAEDAERARRQAERANQVKSEFLAMISHELRTPLNAMIGYTGLLLEGIPEPLTEAARRKVERIEASAQHLRGMIEEILTFSRLEAGESRVDWEEVAPAALLAEVEGLLEPLAAARGLALECRVPARLPSLESDPRRLRQILINLVGNAIKFTNEGGIRLEVEALGDELVFLVTDTGPGIDPGQLARVFDPFWQAEGGLTRRTSGTGLGLSVARRLTELLGGELAVASTVGRGSTFIVRLPLRPPPPAR